MGDATTNGSAVQNGVTTIKKSPLLVFTAATPTGHTGPMLFVAQTMIQRGYDGIFMTCASFKASVAKIGAEYYETGQFWSDEALEIRKPFAYDINRLKFDLEHVFHRGIPVHYRDMKALLEMVHKREPEREIIIITEMGALAVLPWHYGAPLPEGFDKIPKIIGINLLPLMVTSIDAGPFGTGLPPDSTESGRARNKVINQLFQTVVFKDLDDLQKQILADVGCTVPGNEMPYFMDAWMACYDVLLQVGAPSMEPPRSDLPEHIRCIGPLPKRPMDPNFSKPSWWGELESNLSLPRDSPDRKKVLIVSQGTVATDHKDLVIPTIKAFSQRPDILVIAILGEKGASLPADIEIPSNARVIDYLSYDAVLPHVDVFVNNASYGAQTHSINSGVPMVLGGETEDKFEVAALAEWAGFAVNLRTQTPSQDMIYQGVEKVLGDRKYKVAAKRMMQEGLDMDAMGTIEKQIEAFTTR